MKLKLAVILFILIIILGCGLKMDESKREKHIFYPHGRIIEIQGKNACSDDFGKYEFDSIVSALKVENSIVHYPIREKNVKPRDYALYVSKQIDHLIKTGIKPNSITVVGASKGAIITANNSDINTYPINYVLIAGNNNYQESNNDWKFHGKVLCIYDSSDKIAGKNYDHWELKENFTTKLEQIEIKTNLGHEFLYKPLKAWIEPTKKWILFQNLSPQKFQTK